MQRILYRLALALCLCLGLFNVIVHVQAPVKTIEGTVADRTGLRISAPQISLPDSVSGARRDVPSQADGRFELVSLPVGEYTLRIDSPTFAAFIEGHIRTSIGDTFRVDAKLLPATLLQAVTVQSGADTVDLATNTLGKTVTQREIIDLPLNGRNFAQSGLLQTCVAPLTSGLLTEGGSLRAGQSYVVNGQRHEANNFILDGAQNVDRRDGGFALRIPIDALLEFRILTATASPEYGGNIGSVTTAAVRSPDPAHDAAIYYASTVAALFNFFNRWVSASGVHAVSEESHRGHGVMIAERGYVRA